jgi:hypothetical protein
VLENYKIDLECFTNDNWSFFHIICYYRTEKTIQYIYDDYLSKMNINLINNIINKKAKIYNDRNIYRYGYEYN